VHVALGVRHAANGDTADLEEASAFGSVSDDGLVTRQRDYWDMAGLLRQLGST